MRREKNLLLNQRDGTSDIHAVKWIPDNGNYKAVFQIATRNDRIYRTI